MNKKHFAACVIQRGEPRNDVKTVMLLDILLIVYFFLKRAFNCFPTVYEVACRRVKETAFELLSSKLRFEADCKQHLVTNLFVQISLCSLSSSGSTKKIHLVAEMVQCSTEKKSQKCHQNTSW